ncbi:helix-turn-helix domain-containing protein [Streptomyces antarcticus]|uniref:helix-turn-helix domain-containing protein n=1 Tax=Streptomyces antarcticus TaxID=2996458 RepID=UPI002270F645|nr:MULTISPECIES: helix-turn-helix transcriptional regulator [unclassified Streptomyces]MCY0946445.1 helix-turn-helix transcriptional regulator [Streptomyces sp. H34-AA3]MCZ4086454.1 helix-turn-helix transcriptional regulator [Streptomyces sp. H34-S5]
MTDDSGDDEVEPDDNLRSFGETVKASRKRAGLTQEQLAPLIGYSVQYVGSVEQGRRHPSQKFVNKTEAVLDTFGVIGIAAKQLTRRRGLASWFRRWAELEEGAVTLNTYECRSVPGLLQPEPYARALIDNVPPLATPEEADARIAARTERQKLLLRTPYVLFSFIIEQALIERRTGGTDVTRELIDRLLACGALPNVDVQIMPLVQPVHAGTDGPFQLLETNEHEWLGYSEGQQSGIVISDPKDISLLHQRYAKLRIQALNPADSADLLMRMRGSL